MKQDLQTTTSVEKTEKPEISLGIKRDIDHIYEDPAIVELAERCKEGDTSAMREMSALFRSLCTPPLIKLLDQYEANPNSENENAIETYLQKYFHEKNTAKAYMMWMVRAALYGDKEAATQIEAWPFYKYFSFIPYNMMIGKGDQYISVWASSFLYKIGFIDVPPCYEDCALFYDSKEKYYTFLYTSSYFPADEDGFGAEWDYSVIYFDEFLRRLPGKPKISEETP